MIITSLAPENLVVGEIYRAISINSNSSYLLKISEFKPPKITASNWASINYNTKKIIHYSWSNGGFSNGWCTKYLATPNEIKLLQNLIDGKDMSDNEIEYLLGKSVNNELLIF